MGKIYKRKPLKYEDETISKAINDIKKKKLSICKAAALYNINKTLLIRRLHGKGMQKRGRKPEFQLEEEENIAMCLKKLSQWGFGFSRQEVLDVVHEFVCINNLKTKFRNGRPEKDWLNNFFKRQNLRLKKPEQLEAIRRNATSDPFVIYHFYDVLESTLKELDLLNKPSHIYNLDETSFSNDPGRIKVVGEKGVSAHRTIH